MTTAMRYIDRVDSPLGRLTLASDGVALTGLWMDGQKYFGQGLRPGAREADLAVFRQARAWLARYFDGARPGETPLLKPDGSAFQRAVWRALCRVPYGGTTSYGALAEALAGELEGRVSPRAVGGAVGRNPISIMIPCHRVLGANGSLTGYAGGVERKRFLLTLEGALPTEPRA